MQINNSYQSPNFGMALKITKGGKEFLEQESTKTIQKLRELGDEFRDYKHWDMVVDEHGYHAVSKDKFGQAYTEITRPTRIMDTVSVNATAERFAEKDKRVPAHLIYSNNEVAEAAYNKLNDTLYQIDTTAEFVRQKEILDAAKTAKAEAEAKAKAAHTANIQDLFSNFGTLDVEI